MWPRPLRDDYYYYYYCCLSQLSEALWCEEALRSAEAADVFLIRRRGWQSLALHRSPSLLSLALSLSFSLPPSRSLSLSTPTAEKNRGKGGRCRGGVESKRVFEGVHLPGCVRWTLRHINAPPPPPPTPHPRKIYVVITKRSGGGKTIGKEVAQGGMEE